MSDDNHSCSGGIGVGSVVAGILSWVTWHSIPWVIVNGIFGWAYVIYWMLRYWK